MCHGIIQMLFKRKNAMKMHDKEDFDRRFNGVCVTQLGVEEKNIREELRFIEDLGADSLDFVELILALEIEFDITLPEKAENMQTVGELRAYTYEQFCLQIN